VRPVKQHLPLRDGDTGWTLWSQVIGQARCTDTDLDPDEWFPVSTDSRRARHEAAAALAICARCPVRAECLVLSLQEWDIGQHGIWGGLVAADRAWLRRRLALARGLSRLMASPPGRHPGYPAAPDTARLGS
jgi:WhiB family redox-sensing transcriptional regulator